MPGSRLLSITAAIAVVSASAGEVLAGPEEEAAEIAERGRLLFDRGEHAEALKRYRAAYALFAHPTYLFNQGRAAAALGECTIALDSYRAYIASPDKTTPAGIDYARSEVARLEKTCGKVDGGGQNGGSGNGGNSGNGGDGSNGSNGGDNGGNGSGKGPGGGAGTELGPIDGGDESSGISRQTWRIATYIGAGVTVALAGYYVFERGRLSTDGHYAQRVFDANDRVSPPLTGGDICANSQIDAAEYVDVKAACDDGDAAATRANAVAISAAATGAATLVFIYLGFIRAPGTSTGDTDPAVSFAPIGPGDLGFSASVRF